MLSTVPWPTFPRGLLDGNLEAPCWAWLPRLASCRREVGAPGRDIFLDETGLASPYSSA